MPINATITFEITTEAQRALLIAGLPAHAKRENQPVEITADDLTYFAIDEKGNASLHIYIDCSSADPRAALDEAIVGIKAKAAKEAQQKAERTAREFEQAGTSAAARNEASAKIEAAIDDFFADPAARSKCGAGNQLPGCDVPYDHPRYNEVVAEAKRRAAADAKAKTDFIATWIAAHAPEPIRQQQAEGLLCAHIAISLIADAVFPRPVLADCTDQKCPCRSKLVTCISRRVYADWRAIKAAAGSYDHVSFYKLEGACRHGLKRYTVEMQITVGPLTLTRRMELNPEAAA